MKAARGPRLFGLREEGAGVSDSWVWGRKGLGTLTLQPEQEGNGDPPFWLTEEIMPHNWNFCISPKVLGFLRFADHQESS